MSLFNETVARADRAEKALDIALKENAELRRINKELKHAPWKHKEKDGAALPPSAQGGHMAAHGFMINSLSPEEVEQQFKALDADRAKVKEYPLSVPRILRPIAALFRRGE